MSKKKIFIAATKQNDGKTTVALGLIFNLRDRFQSIGFIKPIGQRYLEEEGQKVDEDSILVQKILQPQGAEGALKDMSPVAVEKGFTERFILSPNKAKLSRRIRESFKRVSCDKELMVIEGTGHAAVGSVFDHSNASVAKFLGARVILVSSGGIGRPIDEIILNQALFKREGIKLLGVIINKVLPDKFQKVNKLVRLGLKRKGIAVLGVIPYHPLLSYPLIRQIIQETGFRLLSGEQGVDNLVKKIVVGAMEPHNALNYLVDGALLITGGDREGMILASLGCYFSSSAEEIHISGNVLTGGFMPHKRILDLLVQTRIPVLLAKTDTYSAASCIHELMVKIRPEDKQKLQAVKRIVKESVDIDGIVKRL